MRNLLVVILSLCILIIFSIVLFSSTYDTHSKDSTRVTEDTTRIQFIPPIKGALFEFKLTSYEQIVKDQVSYHLKNGSMTEKEVRNYYQKQRDGIRQQYPRGDIYAFGYIMDGKPTKVVYAPVNGGRIEPEKSGRVELVKFYDPKGHLLTYLTSLDNGAIYQTQLNGGSGSNKIRLDDRIRNFHFVFGMASLK